jgi:hypothetical protein
VPYKNKADEVACRKRAYEKNMKDPEYRKKLCNLSREWRKANPDKVKIQKNRYTKKYLAKSLGRILQWTENNPERALETSRKYAKENGADNARRIKAEMISAYGGRCVCCGETEEAFLTVDHIFGKGHEHRGKEGIRGTQIYWWLKKQGYPKDAYQLLCFNCNCAKGLRGMCPHQKIGGELSLVSAC